MLPIEFAVNGDKGLPIVLKTKKPVWGFSICYLNIMFQKSPRTNLRTRLDDWHGFQILASSILSFWLIYMVSPFYGNCSIILAESKFLQSNKKSATQNELQSHFFHWFPIKIAFRKFLTGVMHHKMLHIWQQNCSISFSFVSKLDWKTIGPTRGSKLTQHQQCLIVRAKVCQLEGWGKPLLTMLL